MSRDINPFGLRLPPQLRAALDEFAAKARRSLNSEIVSRLENSIERDGYILSNDNRPEGKKIYTIRPGNNLHGVNEPEGAQKVIKKIQIIVENNEARLVIDGRSIEPDKRDKLCAAIERLVELAS